MRIVTIVGARPQFIKAAAVSRAIDQHNLKNTNQQITEILIHTGQHYDNNMSQVFFEELKINTPQYNLGVGSGRHGEVTGKMLARTEEVLLREKPDLVLVYGDTNSTLAGALAAVKLHIPVAHVEAGLRSFNRRMPEETNRVLTDHISTFLFCPTMTAINNLKQEGITEGVFQTGDVMYDAFLFNKEQASKTSKIISQYGLKAKNFLLATVHREENTDDTDAFVNIINALSEIATKEAPVVMAVHPRTRKAMKGIERKIQLSSHLCLIPPVSYLDMIVLEDQARIILTDSGGIQKEAYFSKVPCITLREETEWLETEQDGWNYIGGRQTETILSAYQTAVQSGERKRSNPYGDGTASQLIVQNMLFALNRRNYPFNHFSDTHKN